MKDVQALEIKCIFFNNKATTKRTTALTDLRRLAVDLKNSKVVASRMLKEDLGQTRTLTKTDGIKSWLPEINKWFEDIKSKVREQLMLS